MTSAVPPQSRLPMLGGSNFGGRLRALLSHLSTGAGLRRWLREPLLHFCAAGLLLFAGYAALSADAPAEGLDIRVDEAALLQFVQHRAKVFSEPQARAHLQALDASARARLIDEFVREEALYREALAWGLDRNDYVIRRRLVQSLEFATRDGTTNAPLDETALRHHYEENKAAYSAPPTISFSHIFFSASPHGLTEARRRAHQALSTISGDDPAVGDRFLYHRNYAQHPPDSIASHFGPAMAEKLFALDADPHRWQGPLESQHGTHLVRIVERRNGGVPAFEEIRAIVAHDAQEGRANWEREQILDAIVARYRVHIDPSLGR